MKKLAAALERYLLKKEEIPSTALHVVVGLLFVGVLRLGLEQLPNPHIQKYYLLSGFNNTLAFYTATFFLFAWFAALFFPKEIARVQSVVLFGIFGGLIPPLLTHILPHETYMPYSYFSDFRWDFVAPYQPIGETVGLWLMIGVIGLYFWFKKKNISTVLLGVAGAYALLQCTVWVLAIPADHLQQLLKTAWPDPVFSPFSMDMVLIVAAFVALVVVRYHSFKATFRKFHHSLTRGILVLFGAQIAGAANWVSLFDAVIFIFAYVLIQAENDYFDKDIDRVTNRESAITADDLIYVRFFMALLVLTVYMVQPAVSILLGLFFLFGFAYNHPALRFKSGFLKASFVEGSTAFVCVLSGIFSVPKDGVGSAELWLAIAVGVIFAIISNIRDFKDFAGDKKKNIRTLYVVLEERGIPPQQTQVRIISIASFIYATSLIVLFMLHMPAHVLLVCGVFFLISFIPFFLISHRKNSLSSIITVAQAALFLVYTAFFVLPLLPL